LISPRKSLAMTPWRRLAFRASKRDHLLYKITLYVRPSKGFIWAYG
jgi:hypothetical protein